MWHVKLADFGLAKNTDETALKTRGIGTPGYMAPELTGGSAGAYTPAVDIWALGAVVFSMRTRTIPLPLNQQFYDCVYGKRPEPITNPLFMSSKLCVDFVQCAMRVNPGSRPTIHQVLDHGWLAGNSSVVDHQRYVSARSSRDLH